MRLVTRVAPCIALAALIAPRGAPDGPGPRTARLTVRATHADRAVGFYDPRLRRVVLVGGAADAKHGARDAVWSWSAARWELETDSGPPSRANAAAAYDARRAVAVVAGGAGRAADDSSWTVGGETWEGSSPAAWRRGADMPPRDHHAVVAARDGAVLMFGGIPAGGAAPWPTDTWVLGGDRWTRVASDGPPGRARAALAYDAKRGQVVLFGGVSAPAGPDGAQTFLHDTWIWDGARWRQATAHGPRGRYAHAMAYDERAGVVLLYGGSAAHAGAPLTDMWQWDGVRWTEIALSGASPGFRYQPVMVHDRARGRTVLHGGLQGSRGETWEWDGRRWRAIGP